MNLEQRIQRLEKLSESEEKFQLSHEDLEIFNSLSELIKNINFVEDSLIKRKNEFSSILVGIKNSENFLELKKNYNNLKRILESLNNKKEKFRSINFSFNFDKLSNLIYFRKINL